MKLTIPSDVLADAVTWTARTIPARPAAPVLAGILLTADGSTLTLSAYDYETSTTTTVTANVTTPGTALVSGRLLADIVKALPGKPVTLEVDGGLSIRCGASRFRLLTMPHDGYPALPAAPASTVTLDGHSLAHAVSQVAVAASRDDTLPLLTCIKVEATPGKVTLLATDRYRLALRELAHDGDLDGEWLLRARTLTEVTKTTAGPVGFATSDQLAAFTTGARTLTSLQVDGDYPPVRRLFPDDTPITARVNVADLTAAVKRVALVAERNTPVRLTFDTNTLTLTAGTGDDATATEEFPATLVGAPIAVAFNPTFLIDGLTALDTATVELGFTHPNKPVVFTGVTADGDLVNAYRYLLVPIRFAG
ncbi:DNA polymerase III subunit beta [Sanguibacter hominis ATCC BAA-789]|uniref:Beta sliding clamp n=1 Tax=Sanguibacter hominis ATCC BAA-789 TaxID=1312740 RepID=A0A9X5FBH1_9MICO|nr:DNA polymerase III subunit beta [Sanguibacter hominis ATCC BAA-789]